MTGEIVHANTNSHPCGVSYPSNFSNQILNPTMNPKTLPNTPFSDISENPNFTSPSNKNLLDHDIAALNASMLSPDIINEPVISNEARIKNEDKIEKILFSGMNKVPLPEPQPLIPLLAQKDLALLKNISLMSKHYIKKGPLKSPNFSFNSNTNSNFSDNLQANNLLFNNINVKTDPIVIILSFN